MSSFRTLSILLPNHMSLISVSLCVTSRNTQFYTNKSCRLIIINHNVFKKQLFPFIKNWNSVKKRRKRKKEKKERKKESVSLEEKG